ncbi:hypothetical protein [Citreimonas salinaria]|uniref:Uncharacterized protein n=1 Tax=Citreimonas salinaria TaxID=321339 RepID=A0A1H3HR80_9RHOB|nr:hypothetical protein [Citreimonas salinaria]SDY17930.1 hypothetical protein SAMN05444340_104113 [Citreimonas salinaria]
MNKRRTAFKQVDLTRACKGMMAAGLPVARAEIEPATGKIIVYTLEAAAVQDGADLDKMLGISK